MEFTLFILLAVLGDLSCVLESICYCWIKTLLAAICETHVLEKASEGPLTAHYIFCVKVSSAFVASMGINLSLVLNL